MKLLLYEWCCSGGLAGASARIGAEGRAMLEALAADAVRDASLDVAVLVDPAQEIALPAKVRTISNDGSNDIASLVGAARQADWTVIVAPETDGILLDRVAAVRSAGARALNASTAFITIAADKQATVNALAAAGVPVPAGRSLAPGETVPERFNMPAVRKLRDGVGGEGFFVVQSADSRPVARATRLEAFVAGEPVGVSCLCGPHGLEALPPLRQRFTAGAVPRYLGGDLLADEPLAARARTLARRAVAALGADAGWLGVDLILGDRGDGRDDRVLEVNPRITTSIVAHARLFETSLVAALISAAGGEPPALRPVRTASGCGFRLPLDPPAPAACAPCPTPT
ncbi:ATP-grasp domain-containing protein [bacterium]|nr:ATP-grasp domain-containing protein [bacterium]